MPPSLLAAFALAVLLLGSSLAHADTYTLATPPLLSPIEQKRQYGALADYLSRATGQHIRHETAVNYVSYWERMRKGDAYDLVLDGAHLVDYRLTRLHHQLIAKVTNVLSYTFVTAPNIQVFETGELIGKRVASLPAPSLGAVQLSRIFTNPMRQPLVVPVDNIDQVIERLRVGNVIAAFIPTPMAALYPELNVVQTSEQMPHIAMTASPRVPESVVRQIQLALFNAGSTPEGRAMLASINVEGFERATPETYAGFSKLLEGVWGFEAE